jgi:hypothetical protein
MPAIMLTSRITTLTRIINEPFVIRPSLLPLQEMQAAEGLLLTI